MAKASKPIIKKVNGWLVPLVMKHIPSGPGRVRMMNRVNGIVNERNWYALAEITDKPELLDAIAEHYRSHDDNATARFVSDAVKKYRKMQSSLQAIMHSPDYVTREIKKDPVLPPQSKSEPGYTSILDRPVIRTQDSDDGRYAKTTEEIIEVAMPNSRVRWEMKSGLHNRKFIIFTYPDGRTVMERLDIFSYASAELSADKTKIIIKHVKQ